MRCLQCGAEQEVSARACTECGAPLSGAALESRGDSATVAVPEYPELSRLASTGDSDTQDGAEAASVVDLGASQGDSATVTDDFGVTSALRSRFEMLEELGRGGMGVVYKARDRKLRRLVALKRLHMATAENQRAVDRFWKEARSIAALDHANIVRVYNLIEDELGICIELEYVEGGDLQSLLEREGALPPERVRDVGAQLCDALALAHEKGIIHRDIKPANVLLTARGMPKLTDFGLARDQQGGHTQTGALMGTLVYAAPEQLVSGKHVDARSDLYALGATLYAMAVGETPRTIRLERLPAELREVIGRCLEENPERRFQTAQELKEALLAGAAARVRRQGGDCPECGFDNPLDVHFCQQCGHDLSALFGKCPQCSRENRKDVEFCGGCGFNLGRHYAVEEQLSAATRLRETGALDAALNRCEAALALDPDHVGAKQAVEELRGILEKIPKLYAEAKADEAAGRLEKAQDNYRKILELCPKQKVLIKHLRRIDNAVSMQRWKKAKQAQKNRRFEEALALLRQISEDLPEDPQVAQAINSVEATIAARKRMEARRRYGEAKAAFQRGELEQAREYLRQVLELDPLHETALAGMERLETTFKATECWEKAADLRKAGRLEEAAATLDELLTLIPRHGSAAQQLAEIREAQKERKIRKKKRRRRAILGVGMAVIVLLVAVGAWLQRERIEAWRIAYAARQERIQQERLEQERLEQVREQQIITAPGGNRESAIALGGGLSLEMVWIPPGEFMMGSPSSEKGRERDETQHQVTLTQGFWMGKYEVTQEQWEAVMGNNPSRFKDDKNLPVEQVSWDDCQAFIKKLNNQISGKRFWLPTEAEWEYACRARTTTPFHFGDSISTDQANYNGNSTYGNGSEGIYRQKTTLVGSFPANVWGLHDMHGNVSEWCLDRSGRYPSGAATDPQGPSSGSRRVLRGGAWNDTPRACRSAARDNDTPVRRNSALGFRVVRIL